MEEAPLELRLSGTPIAVIMRTPGYERDLALGFALTEGILFTPDELADIAMLDGNRLELILAAGVSVEPDRFRRNLFSTSSCGVCGKASIDAVRITSGPINPDFALEFEVISAIPRMMRSQQVNFAETGGIHAAAAFTVDGEIVALREDIGRHNAVDKVVGALAPEQWRLGDLGLFVSGRISFEVVQKAAVAGFPMVCGISAASSLAVELGEELGMAVAGFVRDGTCTVYTGGVRIK